MYFLSSLIKKTYSHYKLQIEVRGFDRYRKKYDILSFNDKKKLAGEWVKKYPQQAHFNYGPIECWIKDIIPVPARIIEIGGWRGDLASKALSLCREIKYWHNYDLLEDGPVQKCTDPRYELITLDDYLWNKPVSYDYNALIATHMIEHIKWAELNSFIDWLPVGIRTVLFEAPLQSNAEEYSWEGDHSSHVLEKGWLQITGVMERKGFAVKKSEGDTYVFLR